MTRRIKSTMILLVIAAMGVTTWTHFARIADETELSRQFQMAHLEGIPTTWAEVLASIPPAKPNENAAPIYAAAIPHPEPSGAPSETEAFVDAHRSQFELVDQAVKLPRCQFESGGIDPLDEYEAPTYRLTYAARLVAVRGSLAATREGSAEAVRNAEEILAISRQIDDDGLEMSRLLSDRIEEDALTHLITWAFHRPGEKIYLRAIQQALDSWEAPDLKRMFRGDLVASLAGANAILTPDGRKKLGLKPEDYGLAESFLTSIRSQPRGRINIVEGERLVWKALELPYSKRREALDRADDRLSSGMDAFPVRGVTPEGDSAGRWLYDRYWAGRVQLYRAALRAVSAVAIPKSIPTADLLSPYDGKPLSYKFDGKRMTFTVSNSKSYLAGPTLSIGPEP